MPAGPGDRAPTFILPDITTGEDVSNPWSEGTAVLAFFKVSCPVCQMAAPKVQALADGGLRVTAIGEDPPPALTTFAERYGQHVPTVSEPRPYRVSDAYGITTVPTLVLVDGDGVVRDKVVGWDRAKWNALATAAGGPPVSKEGDGLPSFRPG